MVSCRPAADRQPANSPPASSPCGYAADLNKAKAFVAIEANGHLAAAS